MPPSLRGDIVWCQLFSEPGAGSDLAGLSTKATKVDGGWKLQGQKVWTSMARDAHWGICLARTDGDVAKHKGLSYFLIDIKNSGLDIRPLREITGEALFNEVFFDDVFVPDECLVGEPGDGWKLARTTLANERVSLSQRLVPRFGWRGTARPGGRTSRRSRRRAADGARKGAVRRAVRRADGSADHAALAHRRAARRGVLDREAARCRAHPAGVGGRDGVGRPALAARAISIAVSATQMFLNSQCMSIAGGTTNVQLNIIGERILGSPA